MILLSMSEIMNLSSNSSSRPLLMSLYSPLCLGMMLRKLEYLPENRLLIIYSQWLSCSSESWSSPILLLTVK